MSQRYVVSKYESNMYEAEREAKQEAKKKARIEFIGMFARSRKGNMWTKYRDGEMVLTLTVFMHPHHPDQYAYCIADDETVKYSEPVYMSELEAIDALWEVIGNE